MDVTTKQSDETLEEENSRDIPSSHIRKCGININYGFQHENLAHLRIHEASCTPEKTANAIYKQHLDKVMRSVILIRFPSIPKGSTIE